MKTKKLVASLLAAGLMASGAGLADTNTLTVSASVTGTCKFSSATSTLSFGALDPSSASDASASNTTTYWCTKGVVASTSAGDGSNFSGGSRRMAGTGAAAGDFIPYSLALAGGTQTGVGPGTPLTLTIDGDIVNADYVNATAGSYSDTVTLTITP